MNNIIFKLNFVVDILRYNIERLSEGLPPVEPISPEVFDQNIKYLPLKI